MSQLTEWADFLRSIAQNECMIDNNMLESGHVLERIAAYLESTPAIVRQNECFGYWPLEESVTYPALAEIETAIRSRLKTERMRPEVAAELHTLANVIRALLQHVADERKAAERAARKADPDPLLE